MATDELIDTDVNKSYKEENERLRRALAERIEFIEDMSHELRSGLTFVRGYVDLLQNGTLGPLNEKQMHAISVMARRSEAVVHLLDQMLTLERARAGYLERLPCVDLGEIVYHSVQGAGPAAEKAGVTLQVSADTCLAANIDPRRMVQVMDNLISNAIKFSHSGGCVQVSLLDLGNQAEVLVQDHGLGIAPEDQERVFERLYRTSEGASKASGSGLGLVIVKEIIEAHGGTIWVESALGQGSTFHFRLPKNISSSMDVDESQDTPNR